MHEYLVAGGVCRLPPDLRLRLAAEQVGPRRHRFASVKPDGDAFEVVTLTGVEFKPGEVIGIEWEPSSVPRYLDGVVSAVVPDVSPLPSPPHVDDEPAPPVKILETIHDKPRRGMGGRSGVRS